jgi:putative flippase GtrA
MHYNAVLLIPAYKPDNKLLSLIDNLTKKDTYLDIVIVDDGSGKEFKDIFTEVKNNKYCTLLVHDINKGKGQALKTGLKYCIDKYSNSNDFTGVVTADSDGQHTVKDIHRIASSLITHRGKFIIGARSFDKSTPLRSKFGNTITTIVYKLISGVKITDTQTGLRGLPSVSLKHMLEINGDRYEYEMNVLLSLGKMKLKVHEIPIKTIYIDENKSSHFNPLLDSIRIYSKIIKFAFSSVASMGIDWLIYSSLLNIFREGNSYFNGIISGTDIAYFTGKVVSSFFNFFFNKSFVFKSTGGKKSLIKEVLSYYSLFAVNLVLGGLLNKLLINLGVSPYISKLIADCILFAFSFYIQKAIIFKHKK